MMYDKMLEKYEWERTVLDEIIPRCEKNLIEDAKYIQCEVVSLLNFHRKRENSSINLGIIVRVREDTLGPRISWVRFVGKSKKNKKGQTLTLTEPLKMAGKYRYSKRIFSRFPDDFREHFEALEECAALVRFRTERLAQLRDLCKTNSKLR